MELARERGLQDVVVQAACASGETTYDDLFTRLIVRYHNEELTRDEVQLTVM